MSIERLARPLGSATATTTANQSVHKGSRPAAARQLAGAGGATSGRWLAPPTAAFIGRKQWLIVAVVALWLVLGLTIKPRFCIGHQLPDSTGGPGGGGVGRGQSEQVAQVDELNGSRLTENNATLISTETANTQLQLNPIETPFENPEMAMENELRDQFLAPSNNNNQQTAFVIAQLDAPPPTLLIPNQQQQPQPQQPFQQSPFEQTNENTTMPFAFYDTPETRRQLAKYILTEFHDTDLNSVLVNSQTLMDTNRKEIFGSVISEALGESQANAMNNSVSALINGTAPAGGRKYYGDVFESFQTIYWPFHCVLGLVICTLGIFANLINVIVLTRPNMISAVNTILCAIACSDLIVNISNIPYLMHELADSSNLPAFYSYNWAQYILLHAHLTVTAHTISIWLTCALATWRYCVIRSQTSDRRNWSVSLATRTIFVVVILVPVFCIPNYLSFAIVNEKTKNTTIYKVGFSALAEDSQFIKTFHFWIFSCLTKLLPCLLLTYFTTVLIKLLANARERRMRLTNNLARNSSGNALPDTAKAAPIPNGHKWPRRKASDEPERRPSLNDDHHHYHHQNHRTSGGGSDRIMSQANGFKLGSSLLAAAGIKRGSGRGKSETRPMTAVGANNEHNLQLLAQDMSAQRNVLVINEAAAAAAAKGHQQAFEHKRPPDGRRRHGDELAINGDNERVDGAIKPIGVSRLGDHLDQAATKQPALNHHQLTSSMGAHEIEQQMTMEVEGNGGCSNQLDDGQLESSNKSNSNNLSCHITSHSGSSCATDAECLQVTGSVSSNGSSSNTIDQTVQQRQPKSQAGPLLVQHQYHRHQQQHHHQQQPQQLLVETMPANVQGPCSSTTTTTTRALLMASRDDEDRRNGEEDGEEESEARKLFGQYPAAQALRSASTGGALDLYAINIDNGKAKLHLTKANEQQKVNQTLEERVVASSRNAFPSMPISRARGLVGNRSGSTQLQVGGLLPGQNNDGLTATVLDQTNRPRSIGSATFAPLQIVRFQATHRQLSQNETTTRLLIAVIIVFLVCEFPAGILAALCAILGQDFFDNVYQPMGSLTDMLALINSSVNFILYCFMSTQFRVTFYRVVLHCPAPREINTHNK